MLAEKMGPRIRPIEVFPFQQDGQQMFAVHDPTNLAAGMLVLSGPALFILTLMDGRHNLDQIRDGFAEKFAIPLDPAELDLMVKQLDAAHYLDSDGFARHYQSLVEAYRAAPARICHTFTPEDKDGDHLPETISEMLRSCELAIAASGRHTLAGLIAPHLDFARGQPCYADAYGLLATLPPAERYVILGTNHFGRSTSVTATTKPFQSPLGTTRTDREFLSKLERRCGFNLCADEYDHQREHSVELQVLILQHLLGADGFEIVPLLCHDPCQPGGTAPYDGNGVDLRDLGAALRELLAERDRSTVVIAGADLSHVGRRFGDQCELGADFLAEIEKLDREVLSAVQDADADAFLNKLRGRSNRTRVCSAGSIYVLLESLPGARPELLRYHQAVDPDSGTCVTCTALALWRTF